MNRSGSASALALAGVLLALGTAAGAFGAHGLKSIWSAERLQVYDTAVRYHLINALGLLGIGLALRSGDTPLLRAAALLVVLGIVLFCGSLYALACGSPRALGFVTPLGGVALVGGWLAFAVGVWRG